MTFVYDLFQIDTPVFGRIVFPRDVVERAIESAHIPGAFNTPGLMELCRFEHWSEGVDCHDNPMLARLAGAGQMLEVIGHVQKLEIVDNVLRASGIIQKNLNWHLPLAAHTAVPYMEMHCEEAGGLKIVKSFAFTEVVLVYQAVTMLALRKFRERKSLLGVDR